MSLLSPYKDSLEAAAWTVSTTDKYYHVTVRFPFHTQRKGGESYLYNINSLLGNFMLSVFFLSGLLFKEC